MSLNKPVKHSRADRIRILKELRIEWSKKLPLSEERWEKIMSQFCLDEDVSERCAKEYLRLLQKAGEV